MKPDFGAMEQYVEDFLAEKGAPGVAVAIVRGPHLLYSRGFGVKDVNSGEPVTPDTIFGVASVSKSFTSIAVMQLQEAGLLSVHDPVRKYLPEFELRGGGGDDVTIHHFMTHTAGIPPLPTLGYSIRGATGRDSEDVEEPAVPMGTYDDLMGYIREGDYRILGAPGQYCSYSNDVYGLLGLIIQRVSGQDFEAYMKERVLGPLGMTRSMYDLGELQNYENVTSLYWKDENQELKHSAHWQVAPPFVACGWLKSTVVDLSKYLGMHIGEGEFLGTRLLGSDSVREMAAPHAEYSRDRKYGYGFSRTEGYHGVTLIEHSGGLRGVSSHVGYIPEEGIGAAVLCNTSGMPSGKLWLGAMNVMMGLPVDTPRSIYNRDPWSHDEIACYVGTYRSGEGSTFVFVEKDGKLFVNVDKKEYEVRRDGPFLGVASVLGTDTEVRFYVREGARAWAIGWGGRIIQAEEE